ncbi:hypothetical protein [Devosia limi]|uniref:Uncharacterized protein n=1 Tax=Devosia limi DSM 17137 TaxID=1121477 RepID=A0A1M5FAE7_9HYPH|nr:hypothetical protein [Devosia limi]SHF88041.1 hypothetical protein SAMN02745223_03778 [Devosia limi DSM 17137]
MNEKLQALLKPLQGTSRRWIWLGALLVTLLVLGLTGNLRQF